MTIIPRENRRTFYFFWAFMALFFLGQWIDGKDVLSVDAAVAEEATQAPSEAKRQARVERAMQIAEAAK